MPELAAGLMKCDGSSVYKSSSRQAAPWFFSPMISIDGKTLNTDVVEPSEESCDNTAKSDID